MNEVWSYTYRQFHIQRMSDGRFYAYIYGKDLGQGTEGTWHLMGDGNISQSPDKNLRDEYHVVKEHVDYFYLTYVDGYIV